LNRIFGAIALFSGWLCICFAAFLGLAGSEFLGLNHTEGPLTPNAVYGISAAVVMWLFVFAAILSSLPLGAAIFEPDPRRRTAITAAAMAAVGVALLPDELGRSFGLPLLPGAALVFYGGRLIYRETIALAAPAMDKLAAGGVASARDKAGAADTTGEGEAAAAGEAATAGQAAAAQIAPGEPVAAREASAVVVSASTIVHSVEHDPSVETATTEEQPAVAQTQAGAEDASPAASDSDRECPWCSARVPAGASVCPSCQATLDEDPVAALHLPGLTEVSPELRAYAEQVRSGKPKRGLLSIMMSSPSTPVATTPPPATEPEALRPPSSAVRAEMARIDAEIAAGIAASGTETAADSPADSTPPAPDEDRPEAPAATETMLAEAPRAEDAQAAVAGSEVTFQEAGPADAAPAKRRRGSRR
jgi:hypothetical protein